MVNTKIENHEVVARWNVQVSLGKIVSIVDDEPDIMTLFHDAKRNINGITLFAFTDPILAPEHFEKNKDNCVLVISDFRIINAFYQTSKVNWPYRRGPYTNAFLWNSEVISFPETMNFCLRDLTEIYIL